MGDLYYTAAHFGAGIGVGGGREYKLLQQVELVISHEIERFPQEPCVKIVKPDIIEYLPLADSFKYYWQIYSGSEFPKKVDRMNGKVCIFSL